jgi:hypothetical protein
MAKPVGDDGDDGDAVAVVELATANALSRYICSSLACWA